MNLLRFLSLLLMGAGVARAQGVAVNDSAILNSGGTLKPVAGATITVCTFVEANTTLPCANPLTIYSNSTMTRAIGTSMTADANGNYSYFITPGKYTETTTANGIAGRSISRVAACDPTNACNQSGVNAFTRNISCTIINAIRCISPSNPQGWTGTDIGGWINDAIANCGTACEIDIAAGTYNYSTTINYANGIKLHGAGTNATLLNYTGSGTAVSMQNVAGAQFDNINLRVNNASAVGIKAYTTNEAYLANIITEFRLSGTSSKLLWITGDGYTRQSNTVFVTIGSLFDFGSIGVQIDHAIDTFFTDVSIYGATNSTTAQPLVVDTGTSGLYLSQVATGFGLHGLTVQNANSGGSYGNAPVYIWADQFLADTTTGGDGVLFASSLSSSVVSAHFTNSWAAAAGRNNVGTIVAAGSNGFHISGGQGIYIGAGTRIRLNSGNGILIDSANVAEVRIEDDTISANNQDNSAMQHGVNITAAAQHVMLRGNRIGNILDSGGRQRYGLNVAAVNADQLEYVENDFGGNVAGAVSNRGTGHYISFANFPTTSSTTQQMYGTTFHRGVLSMSNNNIQGTASVLPNSAAEDTGATATRYGNLWLGTAATSNFKFHPGTTTGARVVTIADSSLSPSTVALPMTIASGTAVTTASIAKLCCGTTVNVAATGTLKTDVIDTEFSGPVTASNNGILLFHAWFAADNVNFNYCNSTAASQTPVAMTVKWSVRRP